MCEVEAGGEAAVIASTVRQRQSPQVNSQEATIQSHNSEAEKSPLREAAVAESGWLWDSEMEAGSCLILWKSVRLHKHVKFLEM